MILPCLGQDYTVAITGTLTFSGSQVRDAIDIPLTDDDLYEGSNAERLVVTLFEMSETPLVKLAVDPTEAEVLIGDNDLPEVTLLPENIRVIEDAGTDMTLRATIPFPFDKDLELTLERFHDMDPNTLDARLGKGPFPAGTYLLDTTTVTIPTGDTSVVIGATVLDDIVTEFDQVLLVGVTQLDHGGLSNPHIYPLADRPTAAVTFVSDDTLVLNFEFDETWEEEDGTLQVCITTSNVYEFTTIGRPQTLMLEVRVTNPDGTPGELYGMPIPHTPMDGDVQGCVDLEFANEYYEGLRAYTILMLGHPGLHSQIIIGEPADKFTVAEDDPPELALNYGGNREVAEGQGIDVELELTNGGPQGLHEPLTVRLALTTTSSASTSDIDFPLNRYYPTGNEFGEIPD